MITPSFKERVLSVVRSIPRGSVMTYGEVADRSGNKKAARAVGSLMCSNSDTSVPCHRVVSSDGTLGGFNRGIKEKIRILRIEGVCIKECRIARG